MNTPKTHNGGLFNLNTPMGSEMDGELKREMSLQMLENGTCLRFHFIQAPGTSRRWCDTKSLVSSGLVDWRVDNDDVAPSQCSRLVSALTCVAGNGGVRSSGFKPKGARSVRGPQVGRRPVGERKWTPDDASLDWVPGDG